MRKAKMSAFTERRVFKRVCSVRESFFLTQIRHQARPLGDSVSYMVSEIPPPPEGEDKDLKYLILPITSDRGLCGGVNRCVSIFRESMFRKLRVNALFVDLLFTELAPFFMSYLVVNLFAYLVIFAQVTLWCEMRFLFICCSRYLSL